MLFNDKKGPNLANTLINHFALAPAHFTVYKIACVFTDTL